MSFVENVSVFAAAKDSRCIRRHCFICVPIGCEFSAFKQKGRRENSTKLIQRSETQHKACQKNLHPSANTFIRTKQQKKRKHDDRY